MSATSEAPYVPTYPVSQQDRNENENKYTYHPPKDHQIERYRRIRTYASDLEKLILTLTPKSREQSLAKTKLEEVVFWANAAIARNE